MQSNAAHGIYPNSVKKVDYKKRVSAKDADRKGGEGMDYTAPKLPPLPTFKKVSPAATSSAPKGTEQGVKKKKKVTKDKKKSRDERRVSRAKKGASRVQSRGARAKRTPATRNSPRVTAAQQPDLSAQVSELQAQIAALRAQLSPSPSTQQPPPPSAVSHPSSAAEQLPGATPPPSTPLAATPQPPVTSNPLPVAAAQQPPSPLDSGPSTRAGAKPLPIYELKQTRPVGYQSSDLFDSSSEESQDGFFTGLLDRARMQWLMGDWEGLGSMEPTAISRSPDRSKLILLAGCGALQSGNIKNFKRLLSVSKAAHVLPDLRKVLLSSTFSVLAKAAQINGSNAKALRFERHAIVEMDKIGFFQGMQQSGRQQEALDDMSRRTLDALEAMERKNKFAEVEIESLRSQVDSLKAVESNPAPPPARPASQPDSALIQATAVSFYSKLNKTPLSQRIPFLLIDSKSIPRSGIHFLSFSLSQILGRQFSFCEWYQEVGCCKSMPCALTGFAEQAQKTQSFRLRLLKSHDHELIDPVYETGQYTRRLILLREPLYTLTSWFVLDQLKAHRQELAKNGILLTKIYFCHEQEVIHSALRCLDEFFRPPTLDELHEWLRTKEKYFIGFMKKWVEPLMHEACAFSSVVCYENLPCYVRGLLEQYREFLDSQVQAELDANLTRIATDFRPRGNAFTTPSKTLKEYFREHESLFFTAAAHLNLIDSFQWASNQK